MSGNREPDWVRKRFGCEKKGYERKKERKGKDKKKKRTEKEANKLLDQEWNERKGTLETGKQW